MLKFNSFYYDDCDETWYGIVSFLSRPLKVVSNTDELSLLLCLVDFYFLMMWLLDWQFLMIKIISSPPLMIQDFVEELVFAL